jgi:type VII secretion-associated protein (TIGR03931 family)
MARAAQEAMARAAMEAIDDPVALLDGRPIAVPEILRALIATTLGRRVESLVVVHPSRWPRTRVDRVIAAALPMAGTVVARTRGEVIRARAAGPAVVIEIDAELTAISAGALAVRGCDDVVAVARIALRWAHSLGAEVFIDAPGEIPGATQTAAAIRKALLHNGITVRTVQDIELAPAPQRPAQEFTDAIGRRVWHWPAVLSAAAAALLLGAGIVVRPPAVTPGLQAGVVSVVEGRVAVEVPPDWTARRVTEGPGSRRVQVGSPADPAAALHITWAYAPGATQAKTAEVLSGAIADQPPGVFVDFDADAQVAGRPAVTYREIRPGRVIRWSVVQAGSVRVCIGCQSAPGREESVRAACEQAVRSARELVGTEPTRPASN